MSRNLPNLGLYGGYALGEDNWADEQNENLLRLSVLVQGGVEGIVSSLPATPAPGTVVILDDTDPTNPNTVAVWDGPEGEEQWVHFEPSAGWLLWDNDQEAYVSFGGTTWAVLETGGGGGIADAPSDGTPYVRQDGGWISLPEAESASAYRVGFFFTATPTANEVLAIHAFTDAVIFADDFAGSVGKVATNPTAAFTMIVAKNNTNIGTLSVSTSGVVTFATTGSSETFAAGDTLRITAPASADATVAGGAFTFKGAHV